MAENEFTPLNEDHAIQAVAFVLSLDRPLQASTIEGVQRHHHLWREELPALQIPQGVEIVVSPSGPTQRPISNSVLFSFLRPDGTPTWVLRFSEAEVVVECSRYTRFDRVWGAAYKYLTSAIELLRSHEPSQSVPSIALQVVDKFQAPAEPYDLRKLFRPNRFLPSVIFEQSPVWHNHAGWFQSVGGHNSLQRLNCDARREGKEEIPVMQRTVFISITHTQQLRYRTGKPINEPGLPHSLDQGMRSMHGMNKLVMVELLDAAVRNRIGLNG
jgi:uncharacterized protein (TIGR04255 family)